MIYKDTEMRDIISYFDIILDLVGIKLWTYHSECEVVEVASTRGRPLQIWRLDNVLFVFQFDDVSCRFCSFVMSWWSFVPFVHGETQPFNSFWSFILSTCSFQSSFSRVLVHKRLLWSFVLLCASLSRESWKSQVEHNSDDELYDECSTLSHLVIGILHFVVCPHVLSLDFWRFGRKKRKKSTAQARILLHLERWVGEQWWTMHHFHRLDCIVASLFALSGSVQVEKLRTYIHLCVIVQRVFFWLVACSTQGPSRSKTVYLSQAIASRCDCKLCDRWITLSHRVHPHLSCHSEVLVVLVMQSWASRHELQLCAHALVPLKPWSLGWRGWWQIQLSTTNRDAECGGGTTRDAKICLFSKLEFFGICIWSLWSR